MKKFLLSAVVLLASSQLAVAQNSCTSCGSNVKEVKCVDTNTSCKSGILDKVDFKNKALAAVKKISNPVAKVTIEDIKYNHPQSGFYPMVLKNGPQTDIVFFNGRYVVLGKMIPVNDKDFKSASKLYSEINIDMVKSSRIKEISKKWSDVLSLPAAVEGNSDTKIYVFSDAFCHYCKQFHQDVRSLVEANSIEIHWIPVSILTPKSIDVGAYMGQDAKKWARWYAGKDKEKIIKYQATPEQVKLIQKSTGVFKEVGGTGTPTIMYGHGGVVDMISGAVPAETLLKRLEGLRKIK